MPEKLKRVFAVLRYIATTISYLYSGFVIYRDEFLSASLAEKYKLGALLGIVFNDTKWWYFFILATVLLFPEILSFFRNKFSKAKISDSSKGLANLESKQEQSEIIFHRMFHHFELTVEGASPEQVINYIKESISASFWYLHISNKVAYDVDWTRSKFYSPQKDNTVVYGIVFHGIKYDLEQREGGVLNRRNGVKIPEMFTVSIISGGLGDNTKLRVNFDTQIQDVCGFFDVMKKELRKLFMIKENRKSKIM